MESNPKLLDQVRDAVRVWYFKIEGKCPIEGKRYSFYWEKQVFPLM
jgi:hypothetical protein